MLNVLRRVWLLLVVVITVGFMVLHWETLAPHFTVMGRIDWRWLGPAALVQALFWYVNARAWRCVLATGGAVTVSTSDAVLQLATVNVGKYLPG